MKRVVSVILLVVLLISVLVPSAYAAEEAKVGGDVLADLRSMTFDGEPFRIDNYPKKSNDENVKLLAINEVAFSASGDHKDYALYVYLYNPSGKEFDFDNSLNSIMLGVAWDKRGVAQDYENFELELVDVCKTSDLENVYIKYRVKDKILSDGKLLVERLGSDRIYAVSEVELLPKGAKTTQTYYVGGRFVFSGYDKGYGNVSTDSTKTIAADVMDTQTLDVHHMYYRTESSSLSTIDEPNHRNQVNAVYFAIDNKTLEKYDELYSVKAEWTEIELDDVVITDDPSFYNSMQPYLYYDVTLKYRDPNGVTSSYLPVPYSFWFSRQVNEYQDRYPTGEYDAWGQPIYDMIYSWDYYKSYNVRPFYPTDTFDSEIKKLPLMLLTAEEIVEGGYESINSKKMLDDVYDAIDDGRLSLDTLPSKSYCKVINNEKNENGDFAIFDFADYKSNHLTIETWFTYGFFPGIDIDEDYSEIKPLEAVTDFDLYLGIPGVMEKYFISSEADAKAFYDFVLESQLSNKTVFILRYCNTDYNADFITVVDSNYKGGFLTEPFEIEGNAYAVDQTFIKDFDIIQLTYLSDGVNVVIPVSASSTNQIGGANTPFDTDSNFWEWLKNQFDGTSDNLKRVLGILLGIIVLLVILWIASVVTNVIVGASVVSGSRSHSRSRTSSRSRKKK